MNNSIFISFRGTAEVSQFINDRTVQLKSYSKSVKFHISSIIHQLTKDTVQTEWNSAELLFCTAIQVV